MRIYGVDEWGIILGDNEIEYIEMKFPEDDLQDIVESAGGFIITNTEAEIRPVGEDGLDNTPELWGIEYEDVTYILPLTKYPSLYQAAYSSYDEMVCEMRKQYEDYLPPDFDFGRNIVHVIGNDYC